MNKVSLLYKYIDGTRGREFSWGKHDCVTWVSDWCVVLGYKDPIGDIRGKWSSEEEAAAVMQENGSFLGGALTRLREIGISPIYRNLASRGDICAVKSDDDKICFGIMDSQGIICLNPIGFQTVPVKVLLKSWRV